MATSSGEQVEISSLSLQQLGSVKKQLDDELEHLTISFQKLRSAQSKFRDCGKSVQNGINPKTADQALLVPLTTSLYIPGTLSSGSNVIIDIGTGYLVEKSTEDAVAFYDAKVNEIGHSLGDLEQILQGKSQNIRVIEDALRNKVTGTDKGV